MMPGGNLGARGVLIALLLVLGAWLAVGFYRVQPAEQGVVMLFGRYLETTGPGLHWFFPPPIGNVIKPNVTQINRVEVGYRGGGEGTRIQPVRNIPQESLMVTGDQNIADLNFTVFWRIKEAEAFVFNIRNPEPTVKAVAESAMREVVGQTTLERALTVGRSEIETRTRNIMQGILDNYKSGILITETRLLSVDPPRQVIDAFNEVQRARQDKERLQNEAEAYRNRVVPTARGEAARVIEEAEAYKERVLKDAEGEAARFVSVYDSYAVAKDITTRRLYLEMMEDVLRGTPKVIIDSSGQGSGVVPYLPLPEIQKRIAPAAGATIAPPPERTR